MCLGRKEIERMTVIIILFYLSLAVVVALVIKKLLEIRALKLSVIEGIEKEFHGKLYELVHDFWYGFRIKVVARTREISLHVLRVAEHAILGLVIRMADKLKRRHRKLYNMVKGEGEINPTGSVSSFLQGVSGYKKPEAPKE